LNRPFILLRFLKPAVKVLDVRFTLFAFAARQRKQRVIHSGVQRFNFLFLRHLVRLQHPQRRVDQLTRRPVAAALELGVYECFSCWGKSNVHGSTITNLWFNKLGGVRGYEPESSLALRRAKLARSTGFLPNTCSMSPVTVLPIPLLQ